MDRNLGASRVAESSTDAEAYGDLYQWGRFTDGHQDRSSSETSQNSGSDVPGHGEFITEDTDPSDWRVPQNNSLWQADSGINNPCPPGFRLPTGSEWDNEIQSWSSNDAAGAFASPLKLVVAGTRRGDDGRVLDQEIRGIYWGSTVDDKNAYCMYILHDDAGSGDCSRARGLSVRCLKD